MKLLKMSLIVLLFSITAVTVRAAVTGNSPQIFLAPVFHGNEPQYTRYNVKNTFNVQTYTNNKTYTPFRNPCPSCIISCRLEEISNGISGEIKTTAGQKKEFKNTTAVAAPGEYRIIYKRYDLAFGGTTYHFSVWKID